MPDPERSTLVPCPRCNAGDAVQHASEPPPALDARQVRIRCLVCLDARLVKPDVAARWTELHPLMGSAR